MALTHKQIFEDITKGLPRFADGRVNFTGAKRSLVLTVVVYYNGEILIAKRSEKVSTYQGLWNGISGFIDEPKSVEDFAHQELSEELSLTRDFIDSVIVADPYEIEDAKMGKAWTVYPVLVTLHQKPTITLDWEHTDFAWIQPAQLKSYPRVDGFDKNVAIALAQLAE